MPPTPSLRAVCKTAWQSSCAPIPHTSLRGAKRAVAIQKNIQPALFFSGSLHFVRDDGRGDVSLPTRLCLQTRAAINSRCLRGRVVLNSLYAINASNSLLRGSEVMTSSPRPCERFVKPRGNPDMHKFPSPVFARRKAPRQSSKIFHPRCFFWVASLRSR